MYRTAVARGAPDTHVICCACAEPAAVHLDSARAGTFSCPACNLDQPVLRSAGDGVTKMELGEVQPAVSYAELTPLLGSFGVAGKASQVTIACDGIPVDVSLDLNSGNVMGLEIAAKAKDLFDMRFLAEEEGHRSAKEKGVSREVQTGDGAFDAAVYIESRMSDEDVKTALASPCVRAAIARLLREAHTVVIERGSVKISISKERPAAFDPDAIRARVAAVRAIAGAPRPLVTVQTSVPTSVTLTKVCIYVSSPIALGTAIYAGDVAPVGKNPFLIGLGAGLVVALALWPLFTKILRGRSTSHRDILVARIVSAISGPLLGLGLLFFANASFDKSTAVPVDMKVISASVDSEESTKVDVTAAHAEGHTHSYTFTASKPETPAYVRTYFRDGAFGWKWETGKATLIVPDAR